MYAYLALASLQVAGGFQQAQLTRENGELQSRINDMNAQFAELDAHNALAAGYGQAARYDAIADVTKGATKAAYASEGVSVGYGTASDVESDNRIAGLLNTLQIQKSARDSAMGYQTQAINMRLGSQMTQLQAGLNANAQQAQGIMSAAATGVSGYERSLSTGKGTQSRTGTNDKAWQLQETTMNVTPSGDGVSAGHGGWTPMSASGDYYWKNSLGNYSFSSETGG